MNRKTLLETMHNCTGHPSLIFALYEFSCRGRNAYSVAVYSSSTGCAFAEDVTDSRQAAESFMELLQAQELEPCHLSDLLEDLLPLK